MHLELWHPKPNCSIAVVVAFAQCIRVVIEHRRRVKYVWKILLSINRSKIDFHIHNGKCNITLSQFFMSKVWSMQISHFIEVKEVVPSTTWAWILCMGWQYEWELYLWQKFIISPSFSFCFLHKCIFNTVPKSLQLWMWIKGHRNVTVKSAGYYERVEEWSLLNLFLFYLNELWEIIFKSLSVMAESFLSSDRKLIRRLFNYLIFIIETNQDWWQLRMIRKVKWIMDYLIP